MKTENVANIGFKSTKSEKPFLSQAENTFVKQNGNGTKY